MADRLRILGVGDAKSRHFARWATRLAERGHEVHVASGRVNPRAGELDGLHVHQFLDLDPLLRVPLVRRYRMAPALAGLAKRVQPDIVHSHYLLPYGYWTARAGPGRSSSARGERTRSSTPGTRPRPRSAPVWRSRRIARSRTSSTRRRSRMRPSASAPTAPSSTASTGTRDRRLLARACRPRPLARARLARRRRGLPLAA